MPNAVVVVLALALLVALGAVALLVSRKQSAAPGLDEAAIRRLLAEARLTSDSGARAALAGAEPAAPLQSAGPRPVVPAQAGGEVVAAGVGAPAAGPAGAVPAPGRALSTGRAADRAPAGASAEETAAQIASLTRLRTEANEAAAAIRRAATEAAESLRERSVADAERLRAQARADAEQTVAAARAEAAELRTGMQAERARLAQEASDALAGEKAELEQALQRLRVSTAALEEDQRILTAERDRLHAERDETTRVRTMLDSRDETLRQQTAELTQRTVDLEGRAAQLATARVEHEAELTRISGLTVPAARTELLARQEEAVRRDAAFMIRRIESEAEATAKTRARAIVAEAVQRVASDQTAQSVVSVVHLPADEVKGRIIGREGRNIRTFETITGVNVIIDDTPEAVLLSCFDPVRREIGRITLQSLIEDGRIHPHRIEEAFERAGDEVEALCARAAEDALLDVGITNLHPELVKLVGRLKYRTSYGQNVLGHLVETSHIARIMASELGIDPKIVARGAFLHDIGKALTHEAQGSHALVGADLARRYGESDDVVHCIEAHHDEVPPATVEAVLTQAADSCSGGRPGARRESLESYVQRLGRIEEIASAKKGVEKVFAMQAGRELRVMVKPDVIDDLEAHVLAREVAKQIEEELTYPGQVRVTVIRESRATEIAR